MVLLAMALEIKLSAFSRDSKLPFFLGHHHPAAVMRDRGSDLPSPYPFARSGGRSGMTQQGLLATVNDPDSRPGTPRVLLGSPNGVAPDSDVRHNGRVKMIVFETYVTFCAHWATWCTEAKRKKGIYDGPPSLGIPRQRVFSITARLGGDCIADFIFALPVYARDFSGGFGFVLGALGFLLPPCTVCGLPILLWGRAAGQSGKDASGLVDGEVVSTEKFADNVIYFTKEQFNVGLRSFSSIPSRRGGLTSSTWPPLSKGHVLVRGIWAGLLEHPERPFSPNRSLVLPGTDRRGRIVEWVEKASFDRLNKLFEITTPRGVIDIAIARNLLAVVREPQSAHKADAKARQERLDQQEEKRQEGTLRKAPGEKGDYSPPAARPPTKKEKKKKKMMKKTLSQVLRIAAPNLEASSSSCRSEPSRPDHTIPESEEAEEPEATSSSLQLVVFHPGPSSPQPEPSPGLQVVDKPEEMRSPSELRERLMQRHGKRLHVPINLGPPQAKKVRLDWDGEDPAKVPAPATTCPDGDGASASAPASPDAAGPSTAAMVQADGPGGVAEVPTGEKALVERSSYTAAAPPRVPYFTDAEARRPLGISESVVPLHPGDVDELRAQLEKAEAELASARKAVSDGAERLCQVEEEKEAIWAEADSLKKEKEALEGQVNEVGQENLQLKKEMEEPRASLAAQKKESRICGRVWRPKGGDGGKSRT
ncbi:hypothetical protein AAG906_008521 [Vitis piasezkii]